MLRLNFWALALATLCVVRWSQPALADDASVFEKPVRLEADGKVIDTGDNSGHSGPTMADVDGDGIPDLVVGDFSGKFRVCRNRARSGTPQLGPMTYLQAGGVPAKVPIYCCVGSSPQFVDFDGDGHLDLISGSYDPGECYLFRGLGQGRYAARQTLVDKTKKPLLRVPNQQQVYQSFGSWPALVDWDGDGDLDLLIGGFDGTIHVFLNEGTRTEPQFAVANFKLQADGKDVKAPGGHAAPVVVDWNGDGRWDILCGSAKGSVEWYRNTGTPTAPRFAAPVTLVPEHKGTGFDEFRDIDHAPIPGIRSQIAALDYDHDGHIDLLIGDFCLTLSPQRGLTPAQRSEMAALLKERDETTAALKARLTDLEAEFHRKYPGDAIYTKQADAEWTKAYFAMRKQKANKDLEAKTKTLEARLQPLLEQPPKQHWVTGPSTCHGYVWLYRRKPVPTANAAELISATRPSPSASTEDADQPTASEPVVVTATATPAQVQPGGLITLTVAIKVGIGWHIQPLSAGELSIPTRLDLKLPETLTPVGDWNAPKPDSGTSTTGPTYSGEVRFTRQLKARPDARPGKIELGCKIGYQACDDSRCLRPTEKALRVPLEITGSK
jgi:hypothetical protein